MASSPNHISYSVRLDEVKLTAQFAEMQKSFRWRLALFLVHCAGRLLKRQITIPIIIG